MNQLHQPMIEQFILSSVLKDHSLIDKTKPYFLSNIGKTLFDSIKELHEGKEPITDSNIILESTKRGVTVTDDKMKALRSIDSEIESFPKYQEQLKKYYLKNNLKSNQIKDLILEIEKDSADFDRIEEILDSCKTSVGEILNHSVSYYTLNQTLEDHKSIFVKRSKGEDTYPTGIRLIDKYNTIGYYPKYITTIFGASGSGKTTVACNLINASINLQIPTVYDSLELSKQFVTDKLISLKTGIPFDTLLSVTDKDGEDISDSLIDLVESERKKVENHNRFVLMEEVNQSFSDLDYEIPHIKKFMGTDYLVMHIDLATMVKDFNKGGDSTASVYEKAINIQHELARKHNVHFVNYVQALRDQHGVNLTSIEDIEKLAPKISQIKNSSAFEERSRVVIGLFRPYYYAERYLKDDPRFPLMDNILQLKFLKQSMGTLPILEFLFKGDIGRIYPFRESKGDKQEDE